MEYVPQYYMGQARHGHGPVPKTRIIVMTLPGSASKGIVIAKEEKVEYWAIDNVGQWDFSRMTRLEKPEFPRPRIIYTVVWKVPQQGDQYLDNTRYPRLDHGRIPSERWVVMEDE